MRVFRCVYVLLFILLLSSCKDDFTSSENYTGKVVVDGYIEAGSFAKVILTSSLPLNSEIDSSKYLDVVITKAKVTISNGEISEILTLKKNLKSFPPHFYATTSLKGEAGKTYLLEIIYGEDTITSVTTIPAAITLDSLWTTNHPIDSLRYVWVRVCDNPLEKNYYRSFTKIQSKQTEFVPTYLSAFSDDFIDGMCSNVALYKGVENFFDKDKQDGFLVGDTVEIKASTMDYDAYKFWNNFEKEVYNAANPFAGHGSNLQSNIVGGIGVWCGYNSKTYRIIVK